MNIFTGYKAFLAFILSLFTHYTYAQKLYISLNGGYNFAANTTTNITLNYDPSSTSTWNKNELSLGKGINMDGVIGYQFTKNIGTELIVSYLMGGITTWNYSVSQIQGSTVYVNKNFSSNMLRLIPTMVFSGGFNTFNPYAKIGCIIGSGSFTVEQETKGDPTTTSVKTKTTVYNGGYALGVYCGLGVQYKFKKHISILAEFTSNNLTYAAEKSELIESKVDGVDMLPGLSVYDKQTEYVDSYYTSNTYNPDKPSKGLKQNISFSSIGFNIGVTYHF